MCAHRAQSTYQCKTSRFHCETHTCPPPTRFQRDGLTDTLCTAVYESLSNAYTPGKVYLPIPDDSPPPSMMYTPPTSIVPRMGGGGMILVGIKGSTVQGTPKLLDPDEVFDNPTERKDSVPSPDADGELNSHPHFLRNQFPSARLKSLT